MLPGTIVESGGLAAGRLVIAAVIDEEHASLGADALVTLFSEDHKAVVPMLREAQSAFGTTDVPATVERRWGWLASVMSENTSGSCAHLCATTWPTPPAPTIRTFDMIRGSLRS